MRRDLVTWLPALVVLAAITFLAAPPAEAQAQPDHLKCYSIKDPNPNQLTQRDFQNQFGTERCVFPIRASLFCVETIKDGLDDPRGGPAGHFLCYTIRGCPTPTVNDQFGERVVRVSGAQYLCTPTLKLAHP